MAIAPKNKKMEIKNLFIFLILIIGIQSCQDTSNPILSLNDNFVYPLKIGNKWNYNVSTVYTNIQPDSIKTLLNDFIFNIQLSITKDTLLDSNLVYEMKQESDDFSDSYAYYSNEEDGFLKYGYSNGPNLGLPKANTIKRFLFKGTYFNSITELINKQDETVFAFKKLNDSINFFEQPQKIYVYPFKVGNEWVFSSEYIFINKEIVSKELVQISSGIYECFKIKWKFDFDMDGNWDEDFAIYEYVSSKGIIKVTYTIKDITITSIENPDGIGKADVKYERVLTSANF